MQDKEKVSKEEGHQHVLAVQAGQLILPPLHVRNTLTTKRASSYSKCTPRPPECYCLPPSIVRWKLKIAVLIGEHLTGKSDVKHSQCSVIITFRIYARETFYMLTASQFGTKYPPLRRL